MDDDGFYPFERPRRFAHWGESGGVEPADDGPRRGPVLDDWPLPGQSPPEPPEAAQKPPRAALHVVPDPESGVVDTTPEEPVPDVTLSWDDPAAPDPVVGVRAYFKWLLSKLDSKPEERPPWER